MKKTFNELIVNLVTKLYCIFKINVYFFLVNLLFVAAIFYNLLLTNFITSIIPAFFLIISIVTYFKILGKTNSNNIPECTFKEFLIYYFELIKDFWKVYLMVLFIGLFLIIDLRILFLKYSKGVYLIPFIITIGFLINSIIFIMFITTDKRAKKIGLIKLFEKSLFLSYKLIKTTFLNIIIIFFTFFLIVYYPLLYIVLFSGIFNYMIFSNIRKKFDLNLFFNSIKV